MTRLLVLLILCGIALSSCRYWVLYEFAEQFCKFEDYVSISWDNDIDNKQVKVSFYEPVLDRSILLRYLNAEPFESTKEQNLSAHLEVSPNFIKDALELYENRRDNV